MQVELNSNQINATNITPKDISNIVKGLELLGKKIAEICVHTIGLNIDTKYYHKFDEKLINAIYRDITYGYSYGRKVKIKGNNIYTLEDIKLPDINYDGVMIKFE